jgi:hypothetical protein
MDLINTNELFFNGEFILVQEQQSINKCQLLLTLFYVM